ncbi:MAG: cytochrome b/b6 domain-containing protein [Rhodoferax sp.]|nr:cytochrome b/b6 domain-containing protein [Rhodoferax sp.]
MARIYINTLPVRVWHWTNALGFILLIATGLQLRYLDMLQFISFRWAVILHNWIGFVLIANFIVWLGFLLFTDKIKGYRPDTDLKRFSAKTWKQMQFYGWGIFRGDPNPHHITPDNKFNPMQSSMYQLIMMVLVPLQFFTGLVLWDVTRFGWVVEHLGGLRVVDTIHVLLFIFFSGFIVVHIYLCSLGHTRLAHFKAMYDGFEDVEGEGHA